MLDVEAVQVGEAIEQLQRSRLGLGVVLRLGLGLWLRVGNYGLGLVIIGARVSNHGQGEG